MIFRHLLNMRSHPTWVRGLKLLELFCLSGIVTSHPTWVRGLKHAEGVRMDVAMVVAPYVGAWIETRPCYPPSVEHRSHLTWVRGLKLCPCRRHSHTESRTQHGCMD